MSRKNILLSIIIPVYNTEKYLEECIDSLLNQKLTNYEVIFINDGSTDASKEVIFSYKNKYSFMKYFEQTNQGQGTARNVGIEQAQGKYIYFMDSDDYLVENKLNKMLSILEEDQLDGIFFDGSSFSDTFPEKELATPSYARAKEYGLYNEGEELLSAFSLNNDLLISPCLYIIKKDRLIENQLTFPDKYKHEDEHFTTTLFLYLKQVRHVKEVVFKRRVRESSTMTNTDKTPSFIGYVNALNTFDQTYTSYFFLTTAGKKAYKKKMAQLTKAAYTSYSQVSNKRAIKKELKKLRNIVKKYNYFGWSTYFYTLIVKNKQTLKLYQKIVGFIKRA